MSICVDQCRPGGRKRNGLKKLQLTPLASPTCQISSDLQPQFGEVVSALFLLSGQLSLSLPRALFFF